MYEPFTTRPLTGWPVEFKAERRHAPFRAPWSSTMELLHRELRMVGGQRVVLELAITEGDIRTTDGLPRASARPAHPGIILSFESSYGPLRYMTDEFATWQENLRAVALSLEALRKVDRYGVSKRGEQYRGWRSLPPGEGDPSRGRDLIREHGSVRDALKATHPDKGGDPNDFRAVEAARHA